MQALKRNLVALALGLAIVSPAAFSKGPPVTAGKVTGSVHATTPTLPEQATDVVPNKGSGKQGDDRSMGNDSNQNMSEEAKNPPGKGNWWADADTNGDGKISTAEATAEAGLSTRFGIIDTNKDGFVTTEEYRAFYTGTASQGEQHAAAHSAVVTRDVWVRLDADTDGKISPKEAAADTNISGSFALMDSNHDGFVTQEEYVTYEKAHK